MPYNPDVFCPAPFMAVSMESNDELKPCCAYQIDVTKDRLWRCHKFDTWWDTGLAELRADMLAGRKHSACQRCWSEESQGVTSIRQHMRNNWPEYLEIAEPLPAPVCIMAGIGTHCNLKCIFCSPPKSSSLSHEYDVYRSEYIKLNLIHKKDHSGEIMWATPDTGIDALKRMVVNAKEIHFTGGEPLLTPVYKQVLAHVSDPKQVKLIVNTSLEDLSDEWVDIFQRFQAQVYVGVESANPINDYIRYGSTWSTVEANIHRLRNTPSVNVMVSHVFSRTGCWTLPGVFNFAVEYQLPLFLHFLTDPELLQPSGIPMEQRQAVLELDSSKLVNSFSRLDDVQNHLRTVSYNPDLDARFWEYIDILDARRHLDFRKLINDYKA